MPDSNSSILALDVGGRRIGVAIANVTARIAHPLTTIENTAQTITLIQQMIAEHQVASLVVGLPRSLSGDETEQTRITEQFVADLQQQIDLPIAWQDEAVTSRQAEAELTSRNKPYTKGDIDALAATYILEDYLREHSGTLT